MKSAGISKLGVINQLKKSEKRTDVDAILSQIIKINDWLDINIDFLAARLNSLLERKVIVKKKYKMKTHKHLI